MITRTLIWEDDGGVFQEKTLRFSDQNAMEDYIHLENERASKCGQSWFISEKKFDKAVNL